jgi:transcription elongation factor GreA
MVHAAGVEHGDGMPYSEPPPRLEPPVSHAPLQLTQVDFDSLLRELDELRRRHRIELERRLRDARDFGSPADNDDVLTVFEDIAIDQSKIAQLEEAVRSAVIVSDGPAFDGAAGLGCVVEVADGRGSARYRLVGRRSSDAHRDVVSLASPVGKALTGARAGDVVHVALPDGRSRRLEILSVSPPATGGAVALLRDVAAA